MENIKYHFCEKYGLKTYFYQKSNVNACCGPILVYQCPIKQDWVKFEHQSNIRLPSPAKFKSLQNVVRYFTTTRNLMDTFQNADRLYAVFC